MNDSVAGRALRRPCIDLGAPDIDIRLHYGDHILAAEFVVHEIRGEHLISGVNRSKILPCGRDLAESRFVHWLIHIVEIALLKPILVGGKLIVYRTELFVGCSRSYNR